ncbi:MAG: hypothetical protein RLZZ444_1589, partial [Pseudomonadota bacterium]
DGMKTGFICASGFNQVSSATRGGRTVVSVVLGSDSLIARADLSAALLEKGLSTRTGFSMPAIERLPAYGATRDVVSDISEDICKKKGKKVRSEGQDDAHDPKVVSPFSKPIDRPLNVALITIIPAGKAMADAKISTDEGEVAHGIPIPEPRPLN